MANWSTTLDGLSGLSAVQKGNARLILMEKSEKEASLLVSGDPDVAAEAIKALLRKAVHQRLVVVARLVAQTRGTSGVRRARSRRRGLSAATAAAIATAA
eukprot:XP_001689914.1 predicted protein [Chlamydomonas reinhardtii]